MRTTSPLLLLLPLLASAGCLQEPAQDLNEDKADTGSFGNGTISPGDNLCNIDEVQEVGPFTVIRHHMSPTNSGYGLTVAYNGALRDDHADEDINLFVKLNGNQALLPASQGENNDAYAHLRAGPRDCFFCGHPGQDCPDGKGWVCELASDVEEHVFFWAQDGSRLNAWDIEVAAMADDNWDPAEFENFTLRFEERFLCSPN